MEHGQIRHEAHSCAIDLHLELEMTDSVPTIPYIMHTPIFFHLILVRLTATYQQRPRW